MNAFLNHMSFEFRTGLRDKSLLLMNYLFPLIFYFVVGPIMAKLNPSFKDTMIPSMVVFAILSSMVLSLPNPLVAARESGIFRSFRINGVPASSILFIPALTAVLHMVVVATIITVTAHLFFNSPLPTDWFSFVLAFFLMSFASAGIGVLIGIISSNSRITILWSQAIFLPSMMIGGLMIPASMLPSGLQKVGMLLPSTYALSIFRGFAENGGISPIWSIVILSAGTLLSFLLSGYLFNWNNINVSRRKNPILAVLAFLPYILGFALLS
ncbi:MAG TPA: ABC transporter permease [Candidatus Deferrimicrobium sp.]|nr:ABC transporter permease [Candidatus Deferrimicrobium sp.]